MKTRTHAITGTTFITLCVAITLTACKPSSGTRTTADQKGSTPAPTAQPPPPAPKKIEDMKANEVAQDPAKFGFEKGGSMATNPTEAGLKAGMKPSRDDQWTKKTPEGKLYILTIHYEDDKIVYAKWGGFNP